MRYAYLSDSYLKELKTTVVKQYTEDGKHFVILSDTIFYPTSGGQPHDTGMISMNDQEFRVIDVIKTDEGIAHEIDKEDLAPGEHVTCTLDWERRYRLMRMHTATHCFSAVIHNKMGAKITGGGMNVDKASLDFSLETFDRELFEAFVKECNEEMAKGHDVTIAGMDRDKALEDPSLVRLANVLPPAINELRIVTIGTLDRQADGGTHVKNTTEVGTLELLKLENKGKGRKRAYFTINP